MSSGEVIHSSIGTRSDTLLSGMGSSQSSSISERRWRRIFISMVTGENQPKTSNTLATSDTIVLFVTVVLGNASVIVSRNSLVDMFHSMPSVLVYSLISEMVWISRVSRSSSGISSNADGSLEFHFLSEKPPRANRLDSCCWTLGHLHPLDSRRHRNIFALLQLLGETPAHGQWHSASQPCKLQMRVLTLRT